jgi:chemotaxis family two-component system sensor kinase Cph1
LDAFLDDDARDFVSAQLAASASFVSPIVRLGVRTSNPVKSVDLTLHASDDTAMLEFEQSNRTMTLAGDPIAQLKTLVSAVQRTTNLEECCTAAALTMRAATGFDRAMVYQFLPDDSGVGVAESAAVGLGSFLGLHYLRNMGVCASLSGSIICQDKLWGMLVLHHYSPPLPVSRYPGSVRNVRADPVALR